MPYFTPYLQERGYSATMIGLLMACYAAARVVGPFGYAWLADHLPDRRRVLQVATLLACLTFALLTQVRAPLALGACLVLFSWCWNALVPLYDAHTLACLDGASHRYGRLRYWGSIGFVIASLAAGIAFERGGAGVIPPLVLLCMAATCLVMFRLPAATQPHRQAPPLAEFLSALQSRALLAFLALSFLLQMSFGAYYNFFSIYLTHFGHSRTVVGALWAAGVIAEISVFVLGSWLLSRFRLSTLLFVALGGTALRWLVLAIAPESLPLLFAAQTLHLAGFGLFHTVAVLLMPRLLPPGNAARAQALNSSLGWGAGGIAGSLLSGWIWDAVGPRSAYVAATIVVLLALTIAVFGMTRAGVDGAHPRLAA